MIKLRILNHDTVLKLHSFLDGGSKQICFHVWLGLVHLSLSTYHFYVVHNSHRYLYGCSSGLAEHLYISAFAHLFRGHSFSYQKQRWSFIYPRVMSILNSSSVNHDNVYSSWHACPSICTYFEYTPSFLKYKVKKF